MKKYAKDKSTRAKREQDVMDRFFLSKLYAYVIYSEFWKQCNKMLKNPIPFRALNGDILHWTLFLLLHLPKALWRYSTRSIYHTEVRNSHETRRGVQGGLFDTVLLYPRGPHFHG